MNVDGGSWRPDASRWRRLGREVTRDSFPQAPGHRANRATSVARFASAPVAAGERRKRALATNRATGPTGPLLARWGLLGGKDPSGRFFVRSHHQAAADDA